MSDWKPIDSAPRRGWILAWKKHSTKAFFAIWDDVYEEFENENGDHVYDLTHWMEAPKSPEFE